MNINKGSTGSAYTYTGKYTNDNTITMFDYVSDYELSGTYNNCQQDESGYTDVYHALNNAISNGTLISASSSNVTIEFQAQYRTASEAPKVQVNYYDSSDHGSGFQNMKLVSKSSSKEDNTTYNHFIYRFTVARNETVGNMTLSSYSITGLSFKINDGSDLKNHDKGNQNYSINSNDCAGKKYVFHHYNNGSNTGDYFPDNTTGTADAIYSSDYSNPFYFGNFWLGNEATAYGDDVKPVYNNFYWQANMGLKPYDTKGSASTQKLVGNNLSGPDDKDAKGNLLDVNHCTYNANPASNNEVELPYFSKTWAENNKTSDNRPLIRYYDEDVVGGNITFPFYEVYKEHNSTGRYERYYQFDSREANLKFNIQNTNDITNHKGYFSESNTDIVRHWWDGGTYINYTKNDRSNVGFFPFNENNDGESGNTNAHNLGFGMKMEMDFQLEADGCVKVMNKDSNDKLTDIEGDGVQRVPTIFEFTGDDDLWVFIDGNLVLDMGGDHFKSHGKIDFYNKTATVDSAIDFGTENARDDLGANPTAAYVNSSSSPTFLSLLSGHNFDSTNPGKYDTTTTHTLTVFYMERGMMDSNLLIRFNYSPIPNNSRMKIAEVTKFDDVNEGLKPATKRAAEGDVFKYTVTNKLPSNILPAEIENPLSSGAKYPELGAYTRTAEGNSSWTTTLTPNGTGTAEDKLFVNGDPGDETYVKDTAYWWVDGFSNGSWLVGKTTPQSGSDNGGDLWLMYGTADILYGDSKRGVESSAEFEKQFTRNSTMKVVQGTNLYRLPDRDANGHTTLFNDSGQLQAVEQTGTGSTQSRTVSNYYSTNYRLIDRNNNDLTTINDLNNTKTFSFNNDASVGDSFAVMLTEFVENTVKVGAITIKKQKPTEDTIIPSNKEFAVKVRFEDVFGIEGVNADSAAEYGSIKYSVYDSSGVVTEKTNLNMAAGKVTVGGVQKDCGIISLKVGEWAAISGIPVDTKYIIYEEEPKYAPTYVNNNSNVSVGTINTTGDSPNYLSNVSSNNATVTNFSHSLTIKEVTDFSTVNSGLLTYTKKAAENDVFKYTVKNNSTVDGINSGIPTPTYDTYTRKANGATTAVKLSGQDVQYVQVDDTENVYLDISKFTSWNDNNPVFAAWLYESSDPEKSNVAKEFTLVSDNLYRLDPEDYTKIIILRLDSFIKTDRNENWLSYVWGKRTDNDKKYWWGRIDVGTLIKGYTYQVTGWNTTEPGNAFDTLTTPQKLNTSTVIYNYNNFVYDSSDVNHYVKNVNYEWTDQFAIHTPGEANDSLAGTTGNEGDFYLMFGEDSANDNSDDTYISSATFYNQFARGSTMTVEQGDKLTSPVGGSSIDTLQANNKRGAATSLEDYYTTTRKTLEGSYTTQPAASGTLDENVNSFEFDNTTHNANQSVRITETFKNSVNVGTLKITKEINPTETDPDSKNTTMKNAVFKFRIKLTKVFGVDGNDVSNSGTATYSGITVSRSGTGNENYKMTNYTDDTDPNNPVYYGEFELKQGESLTISEIPAGTHYEIQEIGQTGDNPSYVFNSVKSRVDSGSWSSSSTTNLVQGNISSTHTNEVMFANKRNVGSLTLTKTITGQTNSTVEDNTPFYFTVTLKEPVGVTFAGNYTDITGFSSATKSASADADGCYTYTFSNISVKKDDGAKTIIENIPYGTYYTVTEVDHTTNPHAIYDNDTSKTFASGYIGTSSAVANATVNNVYRKVEMTKTDAKNSDKKIDGAKYVLLKLNSTFTNVYENGTQQAKDGLAELFAGATAENYTTTLAFYLTNDSSGELITGWNGTAYTGTGTVSVNDVTMEHSLTDGYYFFFETSPATDYEVDNSLTSGKLIKIDINDTSSTYTKAAGIYTDPRKTGDLVLKKAISTNSVDTDPATEFTYNVSLSVSESGVKLTDYLSQAYLEGLTGIVTNTISRADNLVTFKIKIKEGDTNKVTIEGLPFGTEYSVTETDESGWKQISTDPSGTIGIGTSGTDYTLVHNNTTGKDVPTYTAAITNVRVGSLELVKNIAEGTDADANKAVPFTYTVTLDHTDSNIKLKDFIKNAQISGVESLDAAHYSDTHIEVNITVTKQTSVTINNIPYGTTYSVSESDAEGWSTKTPDTDDYSGTITSSSTETDAKTATFTNAKTGSLVLKKDYSGESDAITAANVTGETDFTFTVILKGTTNLSLGDYLGNIKRSDYNESDESTHLTISNIGNGQYSFTVPVSKNSPKTIVGLPYGTTYTVTETRPSYPSTVTHTVNDEVTTFTQNSAISSTPSEVEIKNVYATSTPPTPVTSSLTVTKTDLSGNAIKSSPATYYLLKLNSTFDADYENDPAVLSNTFKNAASPSDLSQYYSGGYYGPKQTDSNGRVVFTDSDLTITTGDKYFFFEAQAPYGYAIDNSLTYVDSSGNTHSKILSVTAENQNPTAVYPDPITTGVSVYKTNEYGEGLENGEFDLYYKQENNNTTTPPPTYSYNKPETAPVPEATTKINRNGLTVPEDAAGTSSVTTYTYEYSYPSEPSMPSSTEEDWILPRSDNDYIYFRDYNTGTVNNKDTEAFFYQDYENNQKRYWINTWLTNNDYGQNEEIGYDHRYKIKAQFTKNGSDLKEYEAWERFVDEYTDAANNSNTEHKTRKTVVWKIQPPDGYNKVRFCLYDGGQCIRTTQEFSFVLGNIYTKTGQGDGTDHKWNYPVKGEHWSTNWNGTGAGQSDKRMNYSSIYQSSGTGWQNTTNYVYNNQSTTSSQQAPEQTQRYTATEQKIVFQCNSKQVWHNIHIEFFSSADENDRIGHGFPGYMMEPYAFAGNDYRMKGYLTYELTIPKGATHFRINNGVPSGNFAYKTPITPLNTNTTLNNYGNFFKFPNTPQNGNYDNVDLKQWTKPEITNAGDKYKATYNTSDVESDYDYIYFRLPSGSGWSNHVYAYFYGGGDLRAHNWQRGVYSIWPGVAPVATEYSVSNGGTDTAQHSDHYTYEYTQTLFSETPSNTGSLSGINPESTFQYDGGTVYKFKIPKSERVTYENNGKRVYDKVIFNDGFKKYSANTSTSSNNETGMIGFKVGYIYSPSDTKGQKYYGDATSNYTGRGDYLYINNAANWDNLHVTFYNANGTAILQGGKGYIMQYEGTKDGKKYYRIPIPSGAAKFKINNGKGSGLESTEMGVIYPKQDSVDTSKKDYTTGDMIYTLNTNKSLTRDYPIFNDPTAVPHTSESATLQDSGVDYVTRGDKLYIRNTAEWNGMNIGAVKVKFYDSSNAVIGTTGTYTMIVSETESASVASDNRTNGAGSSTATKWYSIDIPMNAAKFELTAPHATAQQYDIYELINSDGSTDRNYKWTKGDMYYETSGSDALTLLYPTYYQSVDYTATDNYGTGNARGDNLYLVVSDLDKWKNMRVTFYNAGGEAIKNTANDTAIVPNYIGYKNYSPTNSEAVGYWFRIAIPTGAESFRATSSASNSDSGDIYELSQNRTYHFRNDYTPGDMQYRITDTLSGGTYNLSLMYPIFTEEPYYSLNDEVNNSYPTNNITIPTPTSGTNDAPVLYETGSNNITYNWTEGSSSVDTNIYFDNSKTKWSNVYVYLYKNSDDSNNSGWMANTMSPPQTGESYYKFDVTSLTGLSNYDKVIFHAGDGVLQTNNANYTTYGKLYTPKIANNRDILFLDAGDYNGGSPYNDQKIYAVFDSGTTEYDGQKWDNEGGTYGSRKWYLSTVGSTHTNVKFRVEGKSTYTNTVTLTNGGKGQVWKLKNNYGVEFKGYLNSNYNVEQKISLNITNYSNSTTPTAVSATYQPEDRYGMISIDNNGTTPVTSGLLDTNNFINVVTNGAVTKPYIKFLDSSNDVIDKPISLTARLNGSTSDANAGVAQPGTGTNASPYKIRLPKNAKSVELYDDSTKIGDTITLTNDGGATLTVSGTGDSRTVSKTSTTKNSTALQSGVTADEGFIFYKGNMTHAYYYGGVDGEFCAWPGVPYSYSYTDGSDTIYAFQIPTTSGNTNKVYPYVIFNDGANNGNNMTAAISYTGGKIYENAGTTSQYGTWSASPKTVTHTTKTTPTPQGDPEDTPPEYTEIHLATIVTGADGRQKYIKWLKPKPGAEDEVDTEYLDHTSTDIGKDAGIKEVRVKKLGEYYWVETVAPAGYKAVKDKIEFTLTQADTAAGSYITHIVDEPLPGKVLLMKTAKEKVGNTDIGDALLGAKFKLTTKADLNTAIKVARKTDKSEYYVIPDISAGATDESKEEYIAISQSGEYETISDTVTLTVPDPENEGQTKNVTVNKLKEYDELVTDENGYIKIENLVWGDYVLTETAAPHGYSAAANGTTNTVTFTVGKNNSDITQELSLKDEMEPSYIKLFEHINERKDAWGDPTFTFRIKQTHEYIHTYDDSNDTWADTLTEIPDYLQKEVLVSLTVNDDGTGTNVLATSVTTTDFTNWLVESTDEGNEYQGMYHIDSDGRIKVEPGTYEITRMPVSRYEFVTSAYTDQYDNGGTAGNQTENLDNNNAPLEKVTVSGLTAGKTIDVHYYDKVGYYDKFSQVDTKVNKFYTLDSNKQNSTVKGIRIDDYYVDTAHDYGTISGDTLNVNNFKAYKIMSDGTEQQITDSTELARLSVSYTYDSSSKDDEQFDTDFSYSSSTISVGNVSRYHDSVYKLNAAYDGKFSTTFNIVFEKKSTNVTYYTAQVIFKNDSQDTTSANTDTNISYFEEDGSRTHAYEFIFVIADDNGTKTVSDIRHNGTSIGTDGTAWSSAISAMENNFKILSGYNYSRNSWVQLAPSSPSLTDYSSIVGYITGLTPTDGKVDSIEFAAHLTSS